MANELNFDTEANIIKASILAGMRPMVYYRAGGNPYMLISNGVQSVFVNPYRAKGLAEFAVDLKNIAKTMNLSLKDFTADELNEKSINHAASVAINTVVENMYANQQIAAYENGLKMEEAAKNMRDNAEKAIFATSSTEVGERFYIARKNLHEFVRVAEQIGVRPEIIAAVSSMENEKGTKELVSIAQMLDEKALDAVYKPAHDGSHNADGEKDI